MNMSYSEAFKMDESTFDKNIGMYKFLDNL